MSSRLLEVGPVRLVQGSGRLLRALDQPIHFARVNLLSIYEKVNVIWTSVLEDAMTWSGFCTKSQNVRWTQSAAHAPTRYRDVVPTVSSSESGL